MVIMVTLAIIFGIKNKNKDIKTKLKVLPAAYQSMTDVLLEGARKGYWRPDAEQTRRLVSMHDYLVRQQEEARPVQTGNDSLTQHDDVVSTDGEPSSGFPWGSAGILALLLAGALILTIWSVRRR